MDLEHRIARLEAIEAIKQLKAHYARVCDDNYDPEGMRPLFTEDAVWEDTAGFLGRFEGREAICEFFRGVSEPITWALHYMMAPKIVVDDDLKHATGDWYVYVPTTLNGEPVWVMGIYSDRYRNDDGQWRFSHVKVDLQAITPFDKGWVDVPKIGSIADSV